MNAPIRVPIHPNPAIHMSPVMVHDLALGRDGNAAIATRYGLTMEELDWLLSQDWFAELIVTTRVRLHETGHLWSEQAAEMAKEMLQDLFKLAKANQLAHPLIVETAKLLSGQGNLTPKAGADAQGAQPGFQLNIQINDVDMKAARRTRLDVEPAAPKVSMKIPFTAPAEIVAAPRPRSTPAFINGLPMPDFKIPPPNRDLVGTAAAIQAAVAQPAETR